MVIFFCRVTEQFTLHQTQIDPLRQDIREHSFHFLPLNTRPVGLPPFHPTPPKKFKYPFTRSHLVRRASTLYRSVFLPNNWPREGGDGDRDRSTDRPLSVPPLDKMALFTGLSGLSIYCSFSPSHCVWAQCFPDTQVGLFLNCEHRERREREREKETSTAGLDIWLFSENKQALNHKLV